MEKITPIRVEESPVVEAMHDSRAFGWTMVQIPDSATVDLCEFLDEPEIEFVCDGFRVAISLSSKQMLRLARLICDRLAAQRP